MARGCLLDRAKRSWGMAVLCKRIHKVHQGLPLSQGLALGAGSCLVFVGEIEIGQNKRWLYLIRSSRYHPR